MRAPRRPLLRIACAGLLLLATGCEQLLTDPGPAPGSLTLNLSPSAPDRAVAPPSADRVRVQVRTEGAVLLDSIFPFDPALEELVVPVRLTRTETSAIILVEIGDDALPLLRGSADVRLLQGRVVEAEVRLQQAELSPLSPVSDVTAGLYRSCALTENGSVYCWGTNEAGQLGGVDAPFASMATRLAGAANGGGFTAVEAGLLTTCALTVAGDAYCWGSNQFGSLGSGGSPTSSAAPVRVDSEVPFVAISVGGLHACGLSAEGVVYCWGFNRFGQLGDDTTTDRPTPVRVDAGVSFRSISAGYLHTCGVTTSRRTFCWGLNEFGQLGNGGTDDRHFPTAVPGPRRFVQASAGGLHTCALTEGGEAFCWGFNEAGQLGVGAGEIAPDPVSLGELRLASLTAGGLHTCGVSPAGTAYCWGQNRSGALGTGTRLDRDAPAEVGAGERFGSLSAGLHHTCGSTSDGALLCWGYNPFGQVGDGSRENRLDPTEVLVGDPFFREPAIDEGEMHNAVAALRGGTLLVHTGE